MKQTSTTPYLLRAIWEWCTDNGMTPYLSVKVNGQTRVPVEFVRDGEIVLNLSADATRNLKIGNDVIQFSARFGGVSREVSVPINAVQGIFAKENGQGMAFQPVADETETESGSTPVVVPAPAMEGMQPEPRKPDDAPPGTGGPGSRRRLTVVK